ncbi:hypothetical protein PINS_up001084 [Pythium insidiosum]|nr:hypothetical protein PINS_up001084 [Pythium insidiosum]
MREYVALVDRVLPGWDDPLEYPVALQHKFWKDDVAVEQCQSCGAPFSLQLRRHHCRMCLDIFCTPCCSETLDMALCPGAPVRPQRVCATCFQDAEKNRSLLAVRRIIRENHDMEQQLRDIQSAAELVLAAKQREELKLRLEAEQCGCDLAALDALIQQRTGLSPGGGGGSASASCSPTATLLVKTPPAHKFAPRETVEANEQLQLAHRQLLMAVKVAQCRARKAVERMDATLGVLREAVCFGTSRWHVALRHLGAFLTLRDVLRLAQVSHAMRRGVTRLRLDARCLLAPAFADAREDMTEWRPFVWAAQLLQSEPTRTYLTDLATAVRSRLDSSSSSSSDDNDDDADGRGESDQETKTDTSVDDGDESKSPSQHWTKLTTAALLASSYALRVHPRDAVRATRLANRSLWTKAYAFIQASCRSTVLEHDAQIQGDVQRTFGVSSLRRTRVKRAIRYSSRMHPLSGEDVPLATRQTALTQVLRAVACVNTEIGYCQGLDYVAALLLVVTDWHESDAFWLLTSLLSSPLYQLEQLFAPGLPHLSLRVFQVRLIA